MCFIRLLPHGEIKYYIVSQWISHTGDQKPIAQSCACVFGKAHVSHNYVLMFMGLTKTTTG